MTTKNRHLFVYGTLRKDAEHAMHHVLARHALFVGPATVPGELYSLGEYPGLVRRTGTTARVEGELYEIDADAVEYTLRVLDDYEGLGPAHPPPHEYRRELIPVTLGDGRRLTAWTFVSNRPPDGLRRIHSGDFSKG